MIGIGVGILTARPESGTMIFPVRTHRNHASPFSHAFDGRKATVCPHQSSAAESGLLHWSIMKYEQHPLSASFPAMGDGDAMLLMQDIREHGLIEAGVLYEGKILDGWHRYQACVKAKVEFLAVDYTGDDPAGYVISRNRHRRHLTLSQIAVAVAQCHKWAPAGQRLKVEPGSTLEDMAEEAGVSKKTIQQAKVAVAAGLGDAVRDGQMTVKEAVYVAKGEEPKTKLEPIDEGPTMESMIDEMEQTIRERDAQITSLEAEDGGAELLKQLKMTDHYRREVDVERDKNGRLIKERDQLCKWRNNIISATGAVDPKAALAMVRQAFAK